MLSSIPSSGYAVSPELTDKTEQWSMIESVYNEKDVLCDYVVAFVLFSSDSSWRFSSILD